jgi:photosystem II stability/assembly factor-like uncharacterized protein
MRNLYTFLFLISFFQIQAQSWHWINPANGHHHLNDISFIAPGNGIAVADNGVILHSNNNIWTQAESPVSENLNAVYYLTPTLAWAVGNNGTILKFNGSVWVQQESPVNVTLNDVCFTDETHGWAVGNTILFYDGNSWQVQATASGLKSVSFATPEEGWAAGTWGALKHYLNGEWVNDNSLDTFDFSGICMTDENTVFLNGHTIDGSGVFFENSGSGWQSGSSNGINSGISFTDTEHGFGIENFIAFNTDIYPTVYKFSSGNWSKEFSAKQDRQLTSVEAISENEAFICDTTGFVYHGLEGNWGVSNGFTADSILDIDFTRANNGYFACGTDGIWHYDAGNWTNMLQEPGFRFNQVEFADENYGWAASYKELDMPAPFNYESKLFRYFNGVWTEIIISEFIDIWSPVSSIEMIGTDMGFTFHNSLYSLIGNNWEFFELPLNDSITQLVYMEPYPIGSPGQGVRQDWEAAWMSVKRLEGDTLGVIYYKNFIENNWEITYGTATGGFNDLCISDYMNIYAVGDNGLIARFDGQSWMEFPPVTNEDLLSVYINDENEGWASGRNGTLLRYNGMAWSVAQSNTWNDLHKVSFYQNFGLIGGENGTLISTLPEMPVDVQNPAINLNASSLKIFPNPASDFMQIGFDNQDINNTEIMIFDITGRKVFSKVISGSTHGNQTIGLNLKSLNNGLYLVRASTDGRMLTGKVLIQK